MLAFLGEVNRLFLPYPRQSVNQLRRTGHFTPSQTPRMKKKCVSYTHRFFYLARRKESEIPKVPEKFQLERAGLGEKKIIFSGEYAL